jgi:hypothetical protein
VTNSRPHEDIEYRRQYMARNPLCELFPILARCMDNGIIFLIENGVSVRTSRGKELSAISSKVRNIDELLRMPSTDPHHMATGTPRWDTPFNLIALCRQIHELVERRPVEGMIWCLYAKMIKSKFDSRFRKEFDPAGFCRIYHKSIVGVLESCDTRGWNEISVQWRDALVCEMSESGFHWDGGEAVRFQKP